MQLSDKAPVRECCGKRHWYSDPCPESDQPVDYEKPVKLTTEGQRIVDDPIPLFQRVEELERLVLELLQSKRKRSEYMKEYMRRKRADK